MLEADDSERACIPSKLQLANFCQLRKAEIGPECVKTLSYRACFSPLLLGVATSRLFTTISAGNASERV